jgi:hypothetical protein
MATGAPPDGACVQQAIAAALYRQQHQVPLLRGSQHRTHASACRRHSTASPSPSRANRGPLKCQTRSAWCTARKETCLAQASHWGTRHDGAPRQTWHWSPSQQKCSQGAGPGLASPCLLNCLQEKSRPCLIADHAALKEVLRVVGLLAEDRHGRPAPDRQTFFLLAILRTRRTFFAVRAPGGSLVCHRSIHRQCCATPGSSLFHRAPHTSPPNESFPAEPTPISRPRLPAWLPDGDGARDLGNANSPQMHMFIYLSRTPMHRLAGQACSRAKLRLYDWMARKRSGASISRSMMYCAQTRKKHGVTRHTPSTDAT